MYRKLGRKMSAKMERNVLRMFWEHIGATRLRLKSRSSLPKVRKKRETQREKERREAVKAGKRMICLQLPCAGCRVEREKVVARGGGKRGEQKKEKRKQWQRGGMLMRSSYPRN